jgi:hypothetical protein
MKENKLTYNLEYDINSGAIEVYSPNFIHSRFKSYSHLEATARMHGYNVLEACNSMMIMYSMNYCKDINDEGRKWCFEVVEKWRQYYLVMKSKKKYKCKECGWKGKITDMEDGIINDYSCPDCGEDFNLQN